MVNIFKGESSMDRYSVMRPALQATCIGHNVISSRGPWHLSKKVEAMNWSKDRGYFDQCCKWCLGEVFSITSMFLDHWPLRPAHQSARYNPQVTKCCLLRWHWHPNLIWFDYISSLFLRVLCFTTSINCFILTARPSIFRLRWNSRFSHCIIKPENSSSSSSSSYISSTRGRDTCLQKPLPCHAPT